MKVESKGTEQINLWGIGVTVLIVLLVAFFVDVAELKSFVASAGPFAPLAFILIKASTVVIAPLSGGPLYPIVGLLFGFWPGFLYVLIGDFLGYTIAFWLSRTFGYPLVRRMIAADERSILAKVVRHLGTTKGFVHMCLTCFALPEVIAYGAGLSKLPYLKFILILMPLSAVASAVLVSLGAVLDSAEQPLVLTLFIPLAAGVIILIGGWLFLRGVGKKD